MKNKLKDKKNLGALGLVVLAIVLISTTVFVIKDQKEKIAAQEPIVETVYVGVKDEKKLDNFTREAAVKSLQALLIEVGNAPEAEKLAEPTEDTKVDAEKAESAEPTDSDKDADIDKDKSKSIKSDKEEVNKDNEEKSDKSLTKEDKEKADKEKAAADKEKADKEKPKADDVVKETITARLELLNKEETDMEDVLTKKAIDMLYLSDEFGGEKFNRQFAASSLLIYHDIVRDGTEKNDFNPVIQSYDEIVYLDNKFMTAHIPLDIFVGSGSGIAFEMQYIDGEWKLNPYTAMMSLNLMGILNESAEATKSAE